MSAPTARQLLAEAIHTEIAAVPADARIGDFEPWDSIAHLRLILAVEAALGRELDPDEAIAVENLGDIDTLLGKGA